MFCKWPSFTPHFSIQGETKKVPGTIHNFAKGKPKQNSSKLILAEPSQAAYPSLPQQSPTPLLILDGVLELSTRSHNRPQWVVE